MGIDTQFTGRLTFTIPLSPRQLEIVNSVLEAGMVTDDTREMVYANAETRRRPGGPLIVNFRGAASEIAHAKGFIVSKRLDPTNAHDLRITKDNTGLEYGSEKTWRLTD